MKTFFLLFASLLFFHLFVWLFWFLKIRERGYLLPLFGLLVVLINSFFFFLIFNKDQRLAYFFLGIAFLVQILILIFLLSI